MDREETRDVIVERQGPAAILRLNRPDRLNALTYPMLDRFRAAIDAAADDPDVFGIVVTGAGRAFCAGIDTESLMEATGGTPPPENSAGDVSGDELPALFSYLLRVPKPVIAAINGVAAGGGFVLAMMCDLRFVAEGASLISVFARRGLIAEHGTSWLLPRMIGTNRALDLLWSSRRVDAAEAYRLGLADRLLADGGEVAAALDYLVEMKANVAPRAIATMKAQVYAHLSAAQAPAFHEADALMRTALAHPDAREGVASFLERRPAAFTPVGRGGEPVWTPKRPR